MKGIVHFLTGVAVATFFPDAVQSAAVQSSFVLVLGGIGGLLPDTLDFKLARFLEQPDVDIRPHPAQPNPQEIADRIAAAVNRVAATRQRLILQLRTMKLGADWWQQYSLRFDTQNRAVIVKIGPVVNTSQLPLPAPRSPLDATGRSAQLLSPPGQVGRAIVNAKLLPTYGEETKIDIFGGPSFSLEWRDEQVEINFIPWHRQWSHSLAFATAFGLLAGILFGPTAGAITGLAYAAHIAEDQLGFLGSNLFWPLTKRRLDGLKLIHSGDAVPNFFAVWTMLVLIPFNLDRFALKPIINPLTYFGLAWLPAFLLLLHYVYNRYRGDLKRRVPLLALQQTDIVRETQEVTDA